jgi:uncharacterized protein YbcV (DUF1398 family)
MNAAAMRKALEDSQAGKLTFPEVVAMLTNAGVDSYFADLVRGEETFYTADGETHREQMTLPPAKTAGGFSQPGVVAAIRAAQADQIRYPEFVNRVTAAGTIAYWAFLIGKKGGLLRPQGRVSRGSVSAPETVRLPAWCFSFA